MKLFQFIKTSHIVKKIAFVLNISKYAIFHINEHLYFIFTSIFRYIILETLIIT